MLLSLLLLTVLAEGPQVPAPAPPATFGEATQLAAEGRDSEALAAFQRLAAANPNDREARVWVARLHERLGNPGVAEAVYRSVLLEDPGNVDAMIGVGTTLLARHETSEALDMLVRAEALAPGNETVLEALGRAHTEAGDTVRALRYLERVVAMWPTDQHRLSLEEAQLAYFHRVEVRGLSEDFSGTSSSATNGIVLLNFRLSDRMRIVGRGDAQRKFGISDERGGGGAEWRLKPLTSLVGQVLIGPDNRLLAERDVLGEIDHTYGRSSWTGTYRYLDFNGAWMSVFSPAVSWWASDRLSLGVRWAHTMGRTSLVLENEHGNTFHTRGAYRLKPRFWVTAGYARGIEDFETVSIDQIGNFEANAVSAGFRFDLPSLTSIVGGYDYQARANDVKVSRFTIGLAQRF